MWGGLNGYDAFVFGGRPYVIAGNSDNSIRLYDLLPISKSLRPVEIDRLVDDATTYLGTTREVSVIEIGGSPYAVVAGDSDEGIEIVRLLTSAEVPPVFVSAEYSTTDRNLQITFDKDLDGTATDYTKIHIRDLNHDGGVHLGMATTHVTDGDMITAVFEGAAAETIAAMAHPTMDIDAAAVTDTFGHHILADSDVPVVTSRPFNVALAAEHSSEFHDLHTTATWDYSGRTYLAVVANGHSSFGGRHSDGLQLFNITDSYNIAPLSTLFDSDIGFLDAARDVAVWTSGGHPHLAVTTSDGITLFNVTNPAAPLTVTTINSSSTIGLSSAGYIDAYQHNNRDYLAVASGRTTTHILVLDVTDPANPSPGGYLTDGTRHFRDVERFRTVYDIGVWTTAGSVYAALASADYNSVSVVELTDPAAPAYLGHVTAQSTDIDIFTTDGGTYAATAYQDIIRVLNLTDPADPSVLDSVDLGIFGTTIGTVDVGLIDGRIYAALSNDVKPDVTFFDITSPTHIIEAGSHGAYSGEARSVEIISVDGVVFAAVLFTDPESVKMLRLYTAVDDSPPVAVSATYRYNYGLTVTFNEDLGGASPGIHIREPGESSGGVSLPAGTISGKTLTIQIPPDHRLSEVDNIILSGISSNPHRFEFADPRDELRSDSRAYGLLDIDAGAVHDLAGNPTLARFDIFIDVTPVAITKVANNIWSPPSFSILHLFEQNGQSFLARGYNHGVQIYDMRTPIPQLLSEPITRTSQAGYFNVLDHFILDGRAYLLTSHATEQNRADRGLRVYDVTDPANPSLDAVFYTERQNNARHLVPHASVYWADGLPYALADVIAPATGYQGIREHSIQIINMSDPANPSRVFVQDDIGTFHKVWSADGRTYAAAGLPQWRYSLPLQGIILDITDPRFPYIVEGPRAGLLGDGVFGSFVYPYEIFEYSGGLWGLAITRSPSIYDLTDPYAASVASIVGHGNDIPSSYVASFEQDGRAYALLHNRDGHHVIDVSNPYEPRMVAPLLTTSTHRGELVTITFGHQVYAVDGRGDVYLLDVARPSVKVPPAPVAASYNSANSLLRVNFTLPITEVKHAYLGHDDQFLFTVRDANTNSSIDIITTPQIDRATQVVFQLSDTVNEYIKNNLTDIVLDIDQGAVNGIDHVRSKDAVDIPVTRGDHVPPSPLSVILHNSALAITFDEIMQTTNTTGIQVRGMTHTFNLTGASFNGTVATFQLTPEQITQINNMTSPSLFIVANAFQDPQGNLVRPNVIPIVSAQAMASPTSLSLDVQDSSLVAVSNLTATDITNDTITVSWAGQAGAEGYEVQWTDPQGGKAAAHLPSIFTTHQIEDLTADTKYVIRVAPSANGTVHEIYASANLTVRTLPDLQSYHVPAEPEQLLHSKSENLVSNGSFEVPTVSGGSHIPSGTAGLVWSVSGGPIEIHNDILGGASDGLQHVELDSTASVTISQTISTISGQTYDISFDYKARPDTIPSTNGIQVQWNGVDIASGITFGDTWQTYTTTVNGTGSDIISFIDAGTSDGLGTFLDNVSVTSQSDITPPVITINGSATITIQTGDTYTDAGATCADNTDGAITPVPSGMVDTTTPGIYTISYSCTDTAGNAAPQVSRVVRVQNTTDTTPPVITMNGNATVTIQTGDTYTDAGATCTDDTDGVISPVSSGTVDTTTAESYTISYSCTDRAGNAAGMVTRSIIVQNPPDVTPPVITMNGDASITIHKGDTYTDAGATCTDDTNGAIPPVPVGTVDTTTPGSYTITYHCADTSGNVADTVTRSVIVQNPPDTQPATPQMPVNLVQNGSFEAPTVSGWSHVSSGTAGLIWSVSGGPMEIHNNILGGASDGSQHVELDSTGSVTISQTIPTTSGQSYDISFDYKARPDTTQATNGIQVQWNGADIVSGITFGDTWQTHTVTVTGTGSDIISFMDMGTSDGVGTFLDNVSVIEVTP